MKVLILAAGYGTRLYPLTKQIPKTLLPVKNKPVLEYILEKLHLPMVDEVFIISNKKFFPQFQEWFKKWASPQKEKIKLLHNNSTSPKNRLGAVRDIDFVIRQEKIKDDLLVVGSDNLFSFSLQPFLKFAQSKKPANSIVAYTTKNKQATERFGILKLDTQNKIIDFQEKPLLCSILCNSATTEDVLISTCIYFFSAQKIFLIDRYLKENKRAADSSGGYIKWLVQNDEAYGFIAREKWFDIGSIDEYSFVSHAF